MAEEEDSTTVTTAQSQSLMETAHSLSSNSSVSTQSTQMMTICHTASTQSLTPYTDDYGYFTWESCAHVLSYPDKELFIEPEFVFIANN